MDMDHLRTLLLQGLDPTGPQGFEGFLRDVLTEVTRQTFELMKSGPQGGIDVLQRQAANRFTVGLESKQYTTSKLPLDQLKAKIVDAATSYPGLDLWLLATTSEVPANDRLALGKVGEEDGIAVEILDWPRGAGLPPLAVLCAEAEHAVMAHFSHRAAEMRDLLAAVRRHPLYPAQRNGLLERLTRADVGYAAARARMIDWTRGALADTGIARVRLGSHANLLQPGIKRISRSTLMAAVDGWWNGQRSQAAAILGDEGTGKTWVVLDWWQAHCDALPLTLVVSARDIQQTRDPFDLMAELLARRTELRTPQFWRKRIRLWQLARTDGPRILLIIDGLNEHFMYRGWSDFLRPLLTNDVWGQFAVAVTCRPDHWATSLKNLASLQPPPCSIPVTAFDDAELDGLLRLHGLNRGDFSPEVVSLMRSPCWSERAIALRDELRDSGDVTAARLVMEDWKRRLDLRDAHIAPTTDEFRAWVTGLGRKVRDALETGEDIQVSRQDVRNDLQGEMGRDDDLTAALSEIIDGSWLARVDGTNRFKLNPDRAHHALALVLVDQAGRTATAEAARECIAGFLEPLRGQDFGVRILRAATSIAVLERGWTHHVQRQLAERWLMSQNFAGPDFEEFWRLIPEAPEMFCGLVEDLWLRRVGGSRQDEGLIKGFAIACGKWPHVAAVVRIWVEAWLGTYRLDPDKGAFIGRYDGESEHAKQNRAATEERLRQWAQLGDRTAFLPGLRHREDEGLSWLCHRVPAILSFLPRRPFVPALLAWAVSRALMGRAWDFDEIAWVLRHNPFDAEEASQAVLDGADGLLVLDHPIATDAARRLLEALATPAAMAKVAPLPRPSRDHGQRNETVQVDEVSGVISWDHQTALQWPRSQEIALSAAMGLSAPARDPHTILSSDDRAVLAALPETLAAERVWSHHGAMSEDVDVEGCRDALARWAPEALACLVRRIYGTTAQRTEEGVRQLAWRLPAYLMVLDPSALPMEQGDFVLQRLWQKSASEQIAILNCDNNPISSQDYAILARPSAEDLAAVLDHLAHAETTERISGWLWYLSVVPLDALPVEKAEEVLLRLCGHAETDVRRLALAVVFRTRQPALFEAFLRSGWRHAPAMDHDESAWASLILCQVANDDTAADIRSRINPCTLGNLLVRRPKAGEEMAAFAKFFLGELDRATGKTAPTKTVSFWLDDEEDIQSITLLLEQRGEEILSRLEPVLDGHQRIRWGYEVEFPLVPLAIALMRHRPEMGVRLWAVLLDRYDRGIMRRPALETLPLEGPDHPAVLRARDIMLKRAKSDDALATIAAKAGDLGRQDWLLQCLERDLSQDACAGTMARALTLAGFCDTSPQLDQFWAERLAQPPAPGWLAEVHAWARGHYRRNQWARHWLTQFFEEPDRDRAFAYHQLFMSCADRRAWSWASDMLGSRGETVPPIWKQHLSLTSQALSMRIEEREKKLKDTLYGTAVERILAPWL